MVGPGEPRLDLVIIGAGPVGLFAAYYAGFRALRCAILESLPFVGGQIATFYAENAIYDVPGFPEVTGAELIERLETQARSFDADLRLGARVVAVEKNAEGVRVRWREEGAASEADPLEANAVLLTTGIGRFAPQPIREPRIEAWVGRGVDYHVAEPARFTGRRVLVTGGTQRAVELSLALAEAGAQVRLIHRRERLAIPDALRSRLESSSVSFLPHRELAELEGRDSVATAVLTDRRDGSTERVPTDAVFPCFGYAAHKEALSTLGSEVRDGEIPVDSTMSAAEGVWAAGDAALYPGKVRVLAADFGEACTAVNNIAAAVIPGASVFPGYSSHRGGKARS